MGVFAVQAKVRNWQNRYLPREKRGEEVQCEILVDSGATELALPTEIIERLKLEQLGSVRVYTSDGGEHEYRVFGIVEIELQGRVCQVRAIELPHGAKPLLGAVPLEEMDLHVSPRERKLVPNPRSPDMPLLPLCCFNEHVKKQHQPDPNFPALSRDATSYGRETSFAPSDGDRETRTFTALVNRTGRRAGAMGLRRTISIRPTPSRPEKITRRRGSARRIITKNGGSGPKRAATVAHLELKDRGPILYQVASLRPEGKGELEPMLREYINAAMRRAHYELIDQPDQSYYGEIPGLDGVLATGNTLEECRANLEDALDAWLALGLQLGHAIPEVEGVRLDRLRVQR